MNFKTWCDGLQSEIEWWERYFTRGEAAFPEDYNFRMNARPKFMLEHLLANFQDKSIHVLDVGAGPISTVGIASDKDIKLVACDPLASFYNEILGKFGVKPYVVTQFALAEKLVDVYKHDFFDIVHMINALDHSYFPLAAIQQMLSVCAGGGIVYLEHVENEAVRENYQGLHQWNITEKDGTLIIWNNTQEYNINNIFKGLATVSVTRGTIYGKANSIKATLVKQTNGIITIIDESVDISHMYDMLLQALIYTQNELRISKNELTVAKKTINALNSEKHYNKYPKWLINIICCFVPSKKNRHMLRKHHMKSK